MRRPSRRAGRLALVGLAVAVFLVIVGGASALQRRHHPPAAPGAPPSSSVVHELLGDRPAPLVVTYFFYWYDTSTGQHLRPQDGLPIHFPTTPAPSWRSVDWFERQLTDMAGAGIDVALPDYWGSSPDEAWSTEGLGPMVSARHALVAAGETVPSIGMFYDTSILRGVNLTTGGGIDAFYANIHTFFEAVPSRDWARVDGRPLVWLFLPQDNRFDQRVFGVTYARFTRDFGIRPFVVRATGWDCATTAPACEEHIRTDASYVWGVAQDGMQETELVAAAGPGYDELQIASRPGAYVPRDGGRYYRRNLTTALDSGRPIVAIETWDELHEASGICETVEYGRTYIDLTRSLIDTARQHRA
jgi:hypothetical protein